MTEKIAERISLIVGIAVFFGVSSMAYFAHGEPAVPQATLEEETTILGAESKATSTVTAAATSTKLGADVALAIGGSILVIPDELKVTYLRKETNMRCASDPRCIDGAHATAFVVIETVRGSQGFIRLSTLDEATAVKEWEGYKISLIELDHEADHMATLKITSATSTATSTKSVR